MEQKDCKKKGIPTRFIETSALLILFGAWIVVVYNFFSTSKYEIDREIDLQRRNADVFHPYYQRIKNSCGDVIFTMINDKTNESTKHQFFISHYSEILSASDSMVNITTNMNRSLFLSKEYEQIVENNAVLVVATDFFKDFFNDSRLDKDEIEKQMKNRFWRYIFDAGLKEDNLKNANIKNIESLFSQLATVKLAVGDSIHQIDSLKIKAQLVKDEKGMDILPIVELLEMQQRNLILPLLEEVVSFSVIVPMSRNLDIINVKMQPEIRKYMKVPFIDAYIPHDVVGKIIFSFIIFIIFGGFMWKLLNKLVGKSQ